MPAIPAWDEQSHLDFMKANGISKSYLSINFPGLHFGDDSKARKLARDVDDLAASLAQRHEGKFGSFASLPVPDVDAAL